MWIIISKRFSLNNQSNFVTSSWSMNPLFFKQIVKEVGVDFNKNDFIWNFIFILKPNLKKVMHFQQVMLFSFINCQIYYDKKHSWIKSNGKQQLLTLWHKHFFRFCIKGKVLPLKHSLLDLKVEPRVQRKIPWWQKLLQLIIEIKNIFYI